MPLALQNEALLDHLSGFRCLAEWMMRSAARRARRAAALAPFIAAAVLQSLAVAALRSSVAAGHRPHLAIVNSMRDHSTLRPNDRSGRERAEPQQQMNAS